MRGKAVLISAAVIIAVAILFAQFGPGARSSACLNAFITNPGVVMESSDYECVRDAISGNGRPEHDAAIVKAVLQRLEDTGEAQLLMLVKDKWLESRGERYGGITAAVQQMTSERRANYADALMEICDYESLPYDQIRAGEIMRTSNSYKELVVAIASVSMEELYQHRSDVEYLLMRKDDLRNLTETQRLGLKVGILRRIQERKGLQVWFGDGNAYLAELSVAEPALTGDIASLTGSALR